MIAESASITEEVATLVAKLGRIEGEMNVALIERAPSVRGIILCSLSRNHMFQVGAPGLGKTMVMDRWAGHLGLEVETFATMLAKSTTPSEILGPDSLVGHTNGDPCRITRYFAPEANFILLDELDKASSYILNTMLRIINERSFQNGLTKMDCPLTSFIGSANAIPSGDEVKPFMDRLAYWVTVGDVTDSGFHDMVWVEEQPAIKETISLGELAVLQAATKAMPVPDGVKMLFEGLRRDLAADGIMASPRRWKWCVGLLKAHALLEGRTAVEADDLVVLVDCLWKTEAERMAIASRTNRLANPTMAKAIELGARMNDVFTTAMRTWNEAQATANIDVIEKAESGLTGANARMKAAVVEIEQLREGCIQAGRNTTRIDTVLRKIAGDREIVVRIIMGRM